MLHIKRITTTAALAICLAVPAASVAAQQAAPPPHVDLRSPDARDAAREAEASQVDLRSPDTRDAAREAEASQVDLRSPDARDAGRTIVPAPAPVEIVERRVEEGFQWGDAGIGAAGTLALVLLVACLGMVASQRRRVGRATAPSH